MVIVLAGKIDGKGRGEVLDGLTRDQEKRLVEMGVAAYVDQVAAAPAPDAGAKTPSKAELQERCRELGLSDKGNKEQLQERIDAALADDEIDDADDDDAPNLTAEVAQ